MVNELKLFAVGTTCKVGIGRDQFVATITGIWIRGTNNLVCYKVAWWDGKNHKEEWLEEFEVFVNREPSLSVGFK